MMDKNIRLLICVLWLVGELFYLYLQFNLLPVK
jgi:hypothetical protein